MRKIDNIELRKIQIEILDVVVDFCNKNQIQYFLGYGTLLGAVRHHGFIPWDDDIDVIMLRPDYESFIKEFNKFAIDFTVLSVEHTAGYSCPSAKVMKVGTLLSENIVNAFEEMGVNIDIFPIDTYPSSFINRYIYQRIHQWLCDIYLIKQIALNKRRPLNKKLILYMGKCIFWAVSTNRICKWMNRWRYKFNTDALYVGNSTCPYYGSREIHRAKVFSEVINLTFEQKEYSCPKLYDEFLTNIYGNYMRLPPKEKQITHHAFDAFVK